MPVLVTAVLSGGFLVQLWYCAERIALQRLRSMLRMAMSLDMALNQLVQQQLGRLLLQGFVVSKVS